MKHSLCAGAVLVLALCAACEQHEPGAGQETAVTSQDVKQEMGEAVSTTVAYSQQEMDEYADAVQARIDELGKDIATLKTRVEKRGAGVNADLRRAIDDLEAKKASLKDQAKELKTATAEAWGELKSGVDEAMEELESAYEKALAKFET